MNLTHANDATGGRLQIGIPGRLRIGMHGRLRWNPQLDRDIDEIAHGKLRNYIGLMASTGKTSEQLLVLGRAYLEESFNPDPRYSGC